MKLELKFYFTFKPSEKDTTARARSILRRFLMPYQSESVNPKLSKARAEIEAYKAKHKLSERATQTRWFDDWNIDQVETVTSLRSSKDRVIALTKKALDEKYFCLNVIRKRSTL